MDLLEKAGKAAQMGEVRTWGGKEYIKTPKGWIPAKNAGLSDLISEFKKEHEPKNEGTLPYDAKKVMHALAGVNSKYKDPSLVRVEGTPKGNWAVYYDGKYIGVTVNGAMLSDSTIKKLGWEYHDVD